MYTIRGTLKNAVDCGTYEVEAVPDLTNSGHGGFSDDTNRRAQNREYPRARVNSSRDFEIHVDDDDITAWFPEVREPSFFFNVYLDGRLEHSTVESRSGRYDKKIERFVIDLCAPEAPPLYGKVSGTVTDERGNPVPRIQVQVFDVDLEHIAGVACSARRNPVASPGSSPAGELSVAQNGAYGEDLGETRTNDCGKYSVCYRYRKYRQNEIKTADIRVAVGFDKGRGRPLVCSNIHYNAAADITVDIAIPAAKLDGSSEFADYDRALRRLGCGKPEARKKLSAEQLEFIHQETGIATDHLELLRQAYEVQYEFSGIWRGANRAHFWAQVVYGLLRVGVEFPGDNEWPSWMREYHGSSWRGRQIADKLAGLLERAIDKGIIERTLGLATHRRRNRSALYNEVATLLITVVVYHAISKPLLPQRSSWLDLFSLIWEFPASIDNLIHFGLAWLEHGVSDTMWTVFKRRSNMTSPEIENAQLKDFLQLVEISGYYAPAVELFLSDEGKFYEAIESSVTWAQYFKPQTERPWPSASVEDYAWQVLQRARFYYGAECLATWVENISDQSQTKAAQRISRLSSSPEFAKKLVAVGFESARDIANRSWSDFCVQTGAMTQKERLEALHTYTRARETHAACVASVLQLSPVLNSPIDGVPVPYIPDKVSPDESGNGLTQGGIDLSGLLGAGSLCDCEGRQSVFSPSAYLYDLKRFLEKITDAWAEFESRRREINHLKLSHRNTYTTLPTIDLNIEVLEDLAAEFLGLLGSMTQEDSRKHFGRQTHRETAELELKPEYENAVVYEKFKELVRPWAFPYDMNHEKRRIYLAALDLPCWDILALVKHDDEEAAFDALAFAALRMPQVQYEILVSVAPDTRLDETYGVSSDQLAQEPDSDDSPWNVKNFMKLTQLDFQDVYAITQLKNVFSPSSADEEDDAIGQIAMNPAISTEQPGPWAPPAYTCDPAQYRLHMQGEPTDPPTREHADRIHHFVRLWRALGWPMQVVDQALGIWPVSADAESGVCVFPIRNLGLAELIRQRLKLEPQEVLTFWSRISTDRWEMPFVHSAAVPSLWEQVFRAPPDQISEAAAARSCGISEQFASDLVEDTDFAADPVGVSSRFYRYGRLAKCLRSINPQDILKYEKLRGRIFTSPQATWNALVELEVAQRSGADLSKILPLYLPHSSPKTASNHWKTVSAIEALRSRSLLPCKLFEKNGDFETALSHFLPPDRVSAISQKLNDYALPSENGDYTDEKELVALDSALAEMLALPELLDTLLTIRPDQDAEDVQDKDCKRKDRILTELATTHWNREIAGFLSQAVGLNPEVTLFLSRNVNVASGENGSAGKIIEQFEALCGDGGKWEGWPNESENPIRLPGGQTTFMEEGKVVIPESNPDGITLNATILLPAPGVYQFRAKAGSVDSQAVEVKKEQSGSWSVWSVRPGLPEDLFSFAVLEEGTSAFDISLTITPPAGGCNLIFELVDPSGNVQTLPGTRFYQATAQSDGALEALQLLELAGVLASQWKLSGDDLSALLQLSSSNSNFPIFPPKGSACRPLVDLSDPEGFTAWLKYAQLVTAIKLTKSEERQTLYQTAISSQTSADDAMADGNTAIWSNIAKTLAVDVKYVQHAADKLGLNVAAFANGDRWLDLFDLSRKLHECGVSAETFASWAANEVDDSTVVSLEATVQSKLEHTRSGTDKYRKIFDNIRVLKRDMLCEYLLAYPPEEYHWMSKKDISDYLLTDVEMQPCAQTSRIRFAIAAIQRLITQALAQSESFGLTKEQEKEWQFIYRYRLWEVRRKILLYPENWLKFGYHLHKSPQFEELERTLLQGDLCEKEAKEALTHFAEQLHGIGHLEVVGTCPQKEYDMTGAVRLDRFHVVARTPAEPRSYYHREWVDRSFWTPWKKIELDIVGEQIVPVVNNGQLHLFWLVDEANEQKKPDIEKCDRNMPLDDNFKVLRLAWSVLTSKGWRAKMISSNRFPTRFGHFAENEISDAAGYSTYVEVHGWNQAVQEIGEYQLHPTMSAEGDVVIELYGKLESVTTSKIEWPIADWVYNHYDFLKAMNQNTLANDFLTGIKSAAKAARNAGVSKLRSRLRGKLANANPAMPGPSGSESRRREAGALYLLGTFRLRPDNLVEIRLRSAERSGSPFLSSYEQRRKAPGIGSAVTRNGAFEYDDGSVELYTHGAYRTVLESAGTPVRAVVTRQEEVPSKKDPVFCRIKNSSFFTFKEVKALPPVKVQEKLHKDSLDIATLAVPGELVRATDNSHNGTGMQSYGFLLANSIAATRKNDAVLAAESPWRFALAHHPQTIEILRAVRAGLDRLYDRRTQDDPRAATGSLKEPFKFKNDYEPVSPWVDTSALPQDELEFRPEQSYASYNWELLYHAPLTMAAQLMQIGRHEDARAWIARVFNPRDSEVRIGSETHPEKFWIFKPFVDFIVEAGAGYYETLRPDSSGDEALVYRRRVFKALLKQWRSNPYNPHAIAAFRPQAYQLASIFLYVENMITWGDSLFAAPSVELVEEAARRYEEAYRIIGRPRVSTGAIRYEQQAVTLGDLEGSVALGNVEIENAISLGVEPSPNVEDDFLPDLTIGYFCLPPNPKIKELREKIQDRLFKVHHCLDLLGNPRKLPLYDPPVDPALLADASMAGLNVSQAVMDAYTPRPHYRFRTLLTLAKGILQQVISLGNGLLSAIEKKDMESLNMLKASHESKMLKRMLEVRKLQVEDAEAAIRALNATLKAVEFRREFYESRQFMNAEEIAQIMLSIASTYFRHLGQSLSSAASSAGAAPDIILGAAGTMGSPVSLAQFGGQHSSRIPANLGQSMGTMGDFMGTLASITGTIGSYRRRKEEWDFQAESAKLEAKQINAQMIGTEIRRSIAERELKNHTSQVEENNEVLDFIKTKQTSVRLYEWLVEDISASYYRAFQLAHSMAIQAQRAMQDELGTNERFIGHSHWDSSQKGLQAGERLMGELLDMEKTFHDRNVRPVPKKVNISLARVNPIALAELKLNGWCEFKLSEAFWDKHAPGLYFRRFSSVAVSVPNVAGPYDGVHGRLTIERASYRKEPSVLDSGENYNRQGTEDGRFVDQFPRPGDFIELSSGVQDTGLAGDEQREDRYRPFENLGIDSQWRLDISQQDNAFDLATISDVILHVEYTARDGGMQLAEAARAARQKALPEEGFYTSLRHQFAHQWESFKSGNQIEIDLKPLFPKNGNRLGRKVKDLSVAVLVRSKKCSDAVEPKVTLQSANFDEFTLTFDAMTEPGIGCVVVSPMEIANSEDSQPSLNYEDLFTNHWSIKLDGEAVQLDDAIIYVVWALDKKAEN